MITQEQVLDAFVYRDGKVYWNLSKQRITKGNEAGSTLKNGYRHIYFNGKWIYTHRLVFLMHHGYLPERLDHVNGNPSDNRIENLRPATQSQNMWNRAISKNNTSGIKGVSKFKNKWKACVMKNYKLIYLGLYNTIEEAKKAVEDFRNKEHAEFARHE